MGDLVGLILISLVQGIRMFRLATIFGVVALLLGIVGFGGFAGGASETIRMLFWLAILGAIVFSIFGFTVYYHVKKAR